MTFPELYAPYEAELKSILGFTWQEASHRFTEEVGNAPGIYPDVALLLTRLVMEDSIKTVTEYGSGMSTLFLAAACKKFRKELRTFEEESIWLEKTQKLLSLFELTTDLSLFNGDNSALHNRPSDLLFLDSSGRLRKSILYLYPRLLDSTWILLDDSENPELLRAVLKPCSEHDRLNFFQFNPVGREDRVVLINHLAAEFRIDRYIWSLRPDKVFW